MNAVATWWDSVELWVAGLPFVPQVLLVAVVVVPAAFGVAVVADRVVTAVVAVTRGATARVRRADRGSSVR